MQSLMAPADGYLLQDSLWLVMLIIGLGLKAGDFVGVVSGRRAFVTATLLHRHDMSLPMIINTFIGMAVCMTFFAVTGRRSSGVATA